MMIHNKPVVTVLDLFYETAMSEKDKPLFLMKFGHFVDLLLFQSVDWVTFHVIFLVYINVYFLPFS